MSTISGKMSTFSGKCQPFQENDCQLFQEIKPTPTPSKEEGRFNLYKGLRAIHSTFFRGCTHTERGQSGQGHLVKIDFQVKMVQSK